MIAIVARTKCGESLDDFLIVPTIPNGTAASGRYCTDCYLDLLGRLGLTFEIAVVIGAFVAHQAGGLVLGCVAGQAQPIFDVEIARGVQWMGDGILLGFAHFRILAKVAG